MAEKAVDAANAQHTVRPAQSMGSALVVRLAAQGSAIDLEIADVDAQITDLFRQHNSAEVLLSMAGYSPALAATFLADNRRQPGRVRLCQPTSQRRGTGTGTT